jgi:multidrug resistance protein
LLVLFVTAFVDMVGLTLVLPLLPYYATEFGANALVVGLLISSFSLAQLVCAPVWGSISDRYGRRPAILFGLATTAIAYVVFAFAHSVWLLLLSRVIQGVGGGTIGVVQAYVADVSAPEDRTKSLGWLSAVTSLGAVVGPAFGSVLDQVAGRSAPGLSAAVLALVTAGFAWRFLPESRGARASGVFPAGMKKTSGASAIRDVTLHWREPAPRLIWIYTVAIGAFYGIVPTLPLLLVHRFGVTEHTVGYIFMYFGGMGVLIRAGILGRMVDWLGEARLSRLGIVCLAAGLALTSVARSWPALILAITLMPLGTAFVFPCVTGLLSRVVPSTERGLYMGVQQTYGGVSRVAFPVGAGWAMDRFGLGVPFGVAALLLLATLPLTRAMDAFVKRAP